MEVRTTAGRTFVYEQDELRSATHEKVGRKLQTHGSPTLGQARTAELPALVNGLEDLAVAGAVARACVAPATAHAGRWSYGSRVIMRGKRRRPERGIRSVNV